MTILITGYRGFIGSYIYDFLLKANKYDIDGLTRNEKLPNKNYNIIIHCAGVTPSNTKSDFQYIEDNINFTQKIIDKYPYSKIIFMSSAGIYGSPFSKIITENTIPYRQSFYGMSKYLAEKIIENSKNKYSILRLPTILGINSSSTFITRMFDNVINNNNIIIYNGDEKFNSIIHIDNISMIIGYIIDNDLFHKDVYNIASSHYIYIKDMPQLISKELGIQLPSIIYKSSLNLNKLISIDKIKEKLKMPNTQNIIMQYIKERRTLI